MCSWGTQESGYHSPRARVKPGLIIQRGGKVNESCWVNFNFLINPAINPPIVNAPGSINILNGVILVNLNPIVVSAPIACPLSYVKQSNEIIHIC